MTLTELYAEADRLIPEERHPRLNALIKDNPAHFYVDRVKLPRGTTPKKLADLAKKIYVERQKGNV